MNEMRWDNTTKIHILGNIYSSLSMCTDSHALYICDWILIQSRIVCSKIHLQTAFCF